MSEPEATQSSPDNPAAEAPPAAAPSQSPSGPAVLPDPEKDWWWGTGRRKTAVARVFLRNGSGTIKVNGREFENYFPNPAARALVKQPLLATETADKFDILATVAGGGVNGQAGAVRLGIARALVGFSADLRGQLKKDGLLRSDSRVKERKKYGLAGARKRFQFSKR